MYGLQSETDLSFLLEKELEQIAIGRHQAILRLDGGVEISIESDLEHRLPSGKGMLYSDVAAAASALASLLNSTIKSYSIEPPGNLKMFFSNGDALVIYDSNPSYESYQVRNGEQLIVV